MVSDVHSVASGESWLWLSEKDVLRIGIDGKFLGFNDIDINSTQAHRYSKWDKCPHIEPEARRNVISEVLW